MKNGKRNKKRGRNIPSRRAGDERGGHKEMRRGKKEREREGMGRERK